MEEKVKILMQKYPMYSKEYIEKVTKVGIAPKFFKPKKKIVSIK